MRKDFKEYMMTLLSTGGHCKEMNKALACKYCGTKFQKAKAVYERMQKEKPELFEYQRPEFEPKEDTKEMFGKLMERIKKDTVYRKHIEKLAGGTEEEKDKEIEKVNKRVYRKEI